MTAAAAFSAPHAAVEPVAAAWRGCVPYAIALAAQHAHRDAIEACGAPDVLWLLEHPEVVTTGRRGGEVDVDAFARRGVDVVPTRRGGLATWHGPGQLVGYLICDLRRRGWRVRDVVHGIEDGLCRWLRGYGVVASSDANAPGVWANGSKLGAIGMHVRRGVTMHGFSVNLDVDLSAYKLMNACGLGGRGVTSVRALTGCSLASEAVADAVARAVIREIHARHR